MKDILIVIPPFSKYLASIRKAVISAAFIYGVSALCADASPPKVRTHLPASSIAMSDDALSTFFNPSGLGTGRGLNLYYLRTYQSDWVGDDAFFLAIPGAGFGMEFVSADADTDFTRYTLSGGRPLGNGLYWGTSYSWMNSDNRGYDAFRSLSLGLMYRRRYVSIGAMARDLNRPTLLAEKLGRTYDLGFALRPGTWRTTLSIDIQKTEGIEDWKFRYALEVRPIRELTLRGTLNNDLSFDVRFGINIGNWGIGTDNTFDKNRDVQVGVGYFQYTNTPTTKPPLRRRMFLDLSMRALKEVLPIAKWDDDIAGVLIHINGNDYGIAQLQEMSDAILNFRESGRIVLCYLTDCSTGDYIVAATCDGILIHPSAEVRLIGLRTERSFYKGALDMIGVRAELEHIGKYKSASESFTRKEMSEAQREIQNIILDDLYEQIVDIMAEGRGWNHETVKKRIDMGPYTARQALNAELVDRLVYEDELHNVVAELTDDRTDLVSFSEYANSRLYPQDWQTPQPKLAVIEAKGLMLMGDSFIDPILGTQVMGAGTITQAIRKVKDDNDIKAVVLRVDSGGGLVSAADTIWRELVRLTEVKPLVVSMGDVAASGGYYIAAPADTIVAEPGTITGSIGVISGKYSFKGLYEKLGIHKEILKRGKHADFYTDYGDYSPEEQAILQKQIQEIYDDFVKKVADGRTNLTIEDVDRLGQGRIWSGRQAKEHGLVDQLGGLNLAIAIARQRAGLGEQSFEIIQFPKKTWLAQAFSNFQFPFTTQPRAELANDDVKDTAAGIGSPLRFITRYTDLNTTTKLLNIIRKQRLFLLMPYQISVGN